VLCFLCLFICLFDFAFLFFCLAADFANKDEYIITPKRQFGSILQGTRETRNNPTAVMDKTGVSSYDDPPAYPSDFQPMTVSSSGPAAVPIPSTAAVPPEMLAEQVIVRSDVGEQVVTVPLVQSFVSHMLLACFTCWFCGLVCGLIAFILAGAPISISRHVLSRGPIFETP